jgi:hypothetical protein
MKTKAEKRAYGKAYYERNRETILANHRLYRDNHRDEVIARNKRWRANNPEKWRAILTRRNERMKEERAKARAEKLAKLAEQS